jgi:hypothetical protein
MAVLPVEAGEPWLLAIRYPLEEGLIRLVQPGQVILQHVAVDGCVFRERLADVLQLRFLLVAREADVAALPGGDALLKRRVVERATAPQDALKLALLLGRRPEFLLVGPAARRLFAHTWVFPSLSTRAVEGQDFWLTPRHARLTTEAKAP